ncbi:nucleotidyltransferase domain-containing protein [Alkalihalobacillus sp. NPDC078783]
MPSPTQQIANSFVNQFFPSSQFAILAGSASRGEETPTSDVDLVIFDENLLPYRESFAYQGKRIEAFIHNQDSYVAEFDREKEIGRPILGNMIKEGILLKEHESYFSILEAAKKHVSAGPIPLNKAYIQASRYFIGDLVDDFCDAKHKQEALITLNQLSLELPDFILRLNSQWSGRGKGLTRALYEYNKELADAFFSALEAFYHDENKEPFFQFATEIYKPLGGFLFEGFSMGKNS